MLFYNRPYVLYHYYSKQFRYCSTVMEFLTSRYKHKRKTMPMSVQTVRPMISILYRFLKFHYATKCLLKVSC